METIHRLRFAHVIAEGWVEPGALPGGVEADHHDPHAIQLGAWDDGTLVGTVRLVLPGPGRRLPVEEAFDLTVDPRGQVVEIGRLLIARDRRGDPAHRAWGALFAQAWIEVRTRGLLVLAGAASEPLIARYRALGLPFEILGPARAHWGEQRHPVRLDPSPARPTWFAAEAGPSASVLTTRDRGA